MTATAARPTNLMTPVLIGGAIILMPGFGIRASFGVFSALVHIPVRETRNGLQIA